MNLIPKSFFVNFTDLPNIGEVAFFGWWLYEPEKFSFSSKFWAPTLPLWTMGLNTRSYLNGDVLICFREIFFLLDTSYWGRLWIINFCYSLSLSLHRRLVCTPSSSRNLWSTAWERLMHAILASYMISWDYIETSSLFIVSLKSYRYSSTKSNIYIELRSNYTF